MKNVTATSTYLSNAVGLEPILVVEVAWELLDNPVSYGKKVITGYDMLPTLKSISPLSANVNNKVFSAIEVVNIVLEDTEGTLRQYATGQIIESTVVKVYQAYEGIGAGPGDLIFQGRIEGPIEWNERARTLSFDAVSRKEETDIGIRLTSWLVTRYPYNTIANIDPSVEDAQVPMVFGAAMDVPALRVTRQYEAVTASEIIINHKNSTEDGADSTYIDFRKKNENEAVFYGYTLANISRIMISGHIFGVAYTGQVGNYYRFAVDATYETGINCVKYGQDVLGSLVTGQRLHDGDYDNPNVLWLAEDGFVIEGLTVCVAAGYNQWNYCKKQEGRKCWFDQPWTLENSYTNSDGSFTEYVPTVIHSGQNILDVRTFSKSSGNLSSHRDVTKERQTRINTGTVAYVWDATKTYGLQNEIYFVNSEGSTIVSVRADKPQRQSREDVLHEIPYQGGGSASYYTISSDWYSTGITALILQLPLSFYPNEQWKDEIYVSQRSDVEGGTTTPSAAWGNTANIIKYLFDTWGPYTADTTTFTSVANKVGDYPAGFAVHAPVTLFTLASKIAYQSRCFLTLDGSTVKIRYLSELPTKDLDVDDDNVVDGTIKLIFPETKDVINRLRFEWRETYHMPTYHNILEYNLYLKHEKKETINFDIYNQYACAYVSALWWFQRKSVIWNRASMRLMPQALGLEIYDVVLLDISNIVGESFDINASSVYCNVLQVTYDHENHYVDVVLELPVLLGDSAASDNYWEAEAITRPNNPASLDMKGYWPLPIKRVIEPHKSTDHDNVNLHRRKDSNGNSTSPSDGHNGTSLYDDDVMTWDETNEEWIPRARGGGGGSSVVSMQNHSHQSEENGDGGYVASITD